MNHEFTVFDLTLLHLFEIFNSPLVLFFWGLDCFLRPEVGWVGVAAFMVASTADGGEVVDWSSFSIVAYKLLWHNTQKKTHSLMLCSWV